MEECASVLVGSTYSADDLFKQFSTALATVSGSSTGSNNVSVATRYDRFAAWLVQLASIRLWLR